MDTNYTLMTPGPVPLHPDVLEILAQPMLHHRTPEFEKVFARVLANLKKVFMTEQPVFIHTSTGSGGMESALVNCFSPGDTVIAVVSGKFGERWAEIAETYGLKVKRIDVPWGQAVRPTQVEEALRATPEAKGVLCQACETSTAVLHPVKELAALTRGHQALLLIDAITALGALPLPMDEWGIDVLVAGSQKAFMLPTGLSFISFSKKAWKSVETARLPRFYFDVRKELKANASGESYFSAAVTHIKALDRVLEIFLGEGLDQVFARIARLALATRAAGEALGLRSFPEAPSPSLTALVVPADVDGQKVRADMEKSSRVTVMGGQDQLKGKIIRIGHMGYIQDDDLVRTIDALGASLDRLKPGCVSEAQRKAAATKCREILRG